MTRIGLLMVGHVAETARHIAGDYPELFGALLADHDLELVRYDLDADRFPDSVDDCDGWLSSPSRCSAYDALPWIAATEDLLRELIGRERPYVGICFGHQLLAQALGGSVERVATGWEIGVHDYEVLVRADWMEPFQPSLALIASHEDQVTKLPVDATLLASTAGCPIAGMLVGERAWTLQPHPEFTPELADNLLALRTDLIGPEKVAHGRTSLTRSLDRSTVAHWITRFLKQT